MELEALDNTSNGDDGSAALLNRSGFLWAFASCAIATTVALPLRGWLAPANFAVLYLVAVLLVAFRFGRNPGIVASVLAVLFFDLFLVPPFYAITVAEPQYWMTLFGLLVAALIISHVTANLRHQAQVILHRERRVAALFELSKSLSAALTYEQVVEIVNDHLDGLFHAHMSLLLPDKSGQLHVFNMDGSRGALPAGASMRVAQMVYEQQTPVEFGAGRPMPVYVALRAPMRVRGVLLALSDDHPLSSHPILTHPDQTNLLEICAVQIAVAIERVHYVNVAQAAIVAMESERLRNSLLSAISHDVRTPLTTIVGISTTLASDRPLSDEARKEMVETLQEEALRMDSLVTNLLDMAKLHAGGVKLNMQWQMLEEVIGSALAMLSRPLAGRRIEVEVPTSIPLLEFDAVLLERVFCNLLDNAAKYTPQDSIIWIRAECGVDSVSVSIEDNGPGVRKGMEEAIFDKFTRGDPESALIGVGLGLSISRAIVDAHGGRIRAEKRVGGGARFIFTMPIGSPPEFDFPMELDDVIEDVDPQ